MRPFRFIFSWKWDLFDSFFTERRPFWFIFHRNDTFLLHFSWKWDLFGSFFMKMIHFGSIFTKMGPFEDPYYNSCNCCVSHFFSKNLSFISFVAILFQQTRIRLPFLIRNEKITGVVFAGFYLVVQWLLPSLCLILALE